MDRGERAGHRKGGRGPAEDATPDWLKVLSEDGTTGPATAAFVDVTFAADVEPEPQAPTATASGRKRRPSGAGSTPVPAVQPEPGVSLTPAALSQRSVASAPDIEVLRAPHGFSGALGRTALFVVLAVIALAGGKQVLWNPFFARGGSAGATVPVTAAFDAAAASQAATRYALDYLSYSPASGAAGASALAADVATNDTGSGGQRWNGTGYLRADSALAGTVRMVDASHGLVAVTVRVQVAMPPAKASPTAPAPPQQSVGPAGAAADPGTVPSGWKDLGSRWLALTVPVVEHGGMAAVAGGGAVFSGESPQLVAAPDGAQSDPNLARETQATAATLFDDYAASDVGYVTAPGADVTGLAKAVRFVSLPDWVTATPKQPAGSTVTAASATGIGTVTWQLAGTDLQIAQPYALAMTFAQDRWYIAAIGPQLSATPTS